MSKYKVGDRVTPTMFARKGKSGTVIFLESGPCGILVEFDRPFQGGHNGNGKGKAGCCYWCFAEYLTPLSDLPQTIVIHQSGQITKALLKEGKTTIRTAEAKCSPHDTYDFAVGARIAFERLMADKPQTDEPARDKPQQPEPVKLYCVKNKWFSLTNTGALSKCRVYEVKNKKIKLDDGKEHYFGDWNTLKRLNSDYAACLVPLVKRPAKVGEWVLLTNEPLVNSENHCKGEYSTKYHKGDLVKITSFGCFASVIAKNGITFSGFREHEYLVLDGYTGPDAL